MNVREWLEKIYDEYDYEAAIYSMQVLKAYSEGDKANLFQKGSLLEMYSLAKNRTRQILALWEKADPKKYLRDPRFGQ